MNPSRFHDGGPILDVAKPIWPLVALPSTFLVGGWLIEVVGGWL